MGQRSPEIRAVQALKWGLTWRHLVPRQIESPLKKLLAVGRWPLGLPGLWTKLAGLFLCSFPLKPCFPRACDHMHRFKRYNPIPSYQHCFQ